MRFTSAIESNQKGWPMKNQMFGLSNKFVTVTGHDIKESVFFKLSVVYGSTILKPVISCVNQVIPPPFKLPYSEVIGDDKKLCTEVLTDFNFFWTR